MSPVAATKSSAIEIGTSGLLDPPVDAPIVVGGGVITAARVADVGLGVEVTAGLGVGDATGVGVGDGLGDALGLGLGLGDDVGASVFVIVQTQTSAGLSNPTERFNPLFRPPARG